MDNDQIKYIKHRLQRYEESIKETEDQFDQLETFGYYRACAPYYEKFGIPHLIDALTSDDNICDTFWQEYDRITGKLKAFDTHKGQIYRDLLYADLNNYVAAYHSALCYADMNMITIESDHDLFNRETIRALIAELHRDYNTGEIANLVTTLDEIFLHMKKPICETFSQKSQLFESNGNTHLITSDEHFFVSGENEQTRQI